MQIENFYHDLGKLTYEKLDLLAQSEDTKAPELDFFLTDGRVMELLNQISSLIGKNEEHSTEILPSAMNLCSQCGREFRPGAAFCTGCGKKI